MHAKKFARITLLMTVIMLARAARDFPVDDRAGRLTGKRRNDSYERALVCHANHSRQEKAELLQ